MRWGRKPPSFLRRSSRYWRLRAVGRRPEERRLGNLLIADRDAEPGAELAQFLFVELLLLVRDVAAFAGFAQAVALDGLGQDDRGPALVFDGGFVGGVDFARVVAAAQQLVDLLVGEVVHQLEQLRVFAEEMPAGVAAGLDGVFLVIAVDGLFHAA